MLLPWQLHLASKQGDLVSHFFAQKAEFIFLMNDFCHGLFIYPFKETRSYLFITGEMSTEWGLFGYFIAKIAPVECMPLLER